MVEEKIIDKIRKLMALAGSPNENEAKLAMMRAQQMMAKYNLSKRDIDKISPSMIITKKVSGDVKRSPTWMAVLGKIIADNFKCYCYRQETIGGSVVMMKGLEEDIEIAEVVYAYATGYIEAATRKLRRDLRKAGTPTCGHTNDYIAGFLEGIKKQFEEQTNSNEWGLVLRTPQVVLDSIASMGLEQKSLSMGKRAHSQEHYQKGFQDGNNFNKRDRLQG